MTKDTINNNSSGVTPHRGKWVRWFMCLVLILIVLLGAVYLALQQPSVQNWLTDQVITSLNKTIKGDISIEDLEVDMPSNFKLNEVLVTAANGDTAIYAKKIELNIISTISAILAGSANFDRIGIDGAVVKVTRAERGYQTNMDTIFQKLDYFYDPHYIGPPKLQKDIDLSAEEVVLTNVRVIGDDRGYGNAQDIWIPYGKFKLQSLDIPNNVLTIDDVVFDNPIIKLKAYIGCLLYTSPSPRDRTRSRMPSSA